jgi:hypothetical protein
MLTSLISIGDRLHAEWRTSISGGRPILPQRFLPMRFEIEKSPGGEPRFDTPSNTRSIVWSMPLVDHDLTAAEKAAPLDGGLIEAMARIEPIYDPTRLDGPGALPMAVSAGTASMINVFADRWSQASADPNVNIKVRFIAMAWQPHGARACDAFSKMRAHGWGDPALTGLSGEDCEMLAARQVRPWDQAPVPVAVAWISLPIFAAPLPGSRMSSTDFWAARRAKILEIQARLRQKWEGPPEPQLAAGLRP